MPFFQPSSKPRSPSPPPSDGASSIAAPIPDSLSDYDYLPYDGEECIAYEQVDGEGTITHKVEGTQRAYGYYAVKNGPSAEKSGCSPERKEQISNYALAAESAEISAYLQEQSKYAIQLWTHIF